MNRAIAVVSAVASLAIGCTLAVTSAQPDGGGGTPLDAGQPLVDATTADARADADGGADAAPASDARPEPAACDPRLHCCAMCTAPAFCWKWEDEPTARCAKFCLADGGTDCAGTCVDGGADYPVCRTAR